jgi:hypothetical protein
MTVSGILNSSSIVGVIGDFRSFFRFTAFSYIGWVTTITPRRITQFIVGFLQLAILELIVGGIELIGGKGALDFFSPALGWSSGAPHVLDNIISDAGSWIFGTLSNYNFYGLFMTMSCVLALALYFMKGSGRLLWLASVSALAVVLSFSRHSLLLLALALGCIFLLRRKGIVVGKIIRGLSIAVLIAAVSLIFLGSDFHEALEERIATVMSPDVLGGDPAANIRLYMAMELTPRFLSAYPFFGQGPIAASDAVQFGDTDTSMGPTLKAAPDLPGIATFYFGDVVWVMVLGLYGCFGLAAFGYVFWSIVVAANRVRKEKPNAESVVLAQVCLVMIVVFVVSGFFSLEVIARDTVPAFWMLAGMVLSLSTNLTSRDQVTHH